MFLIWLQIPFFLITSPCFPMTFAFERQRYWIMEVPKTSGPYYQLSANGRHPHAVPHHIQFVHHQEMALCQQQQASLACSSVTNNMLVEIKLMAIAQQLVTGQLSSSTLLLSPYSASFVHNPFATLSLHFFATLSPHSKLWYFSTRKCFPH